MSQLLSSSAQSLVGFILSRIFNSISISFFSFDLISFDLISFDLISFDLISSELPSFDLTYLLCPLQLILCLYLIS